MNVIYLRAVDRVHDTHRMIPIATPPDPPPPRAKGLPTTPKPPPPRELAKEGPNKSLRQQLGELFQRHSGGVQAFLGAQDWNTAGTPWYTLEDPISF